MGERNTNLTPEEKGKAIDALKKTIKEFKEEIAADAIAKRKKSPLLIKARKDAIPMLEADIKRLESL